MQMSESVGPDINRTLHFQLHVRVMSDCPESSPRASGRVDVLFSLLHILTLPKINSTGEIHT